MKVLIADDSATSRAMLRAALSRWGYEVVMAENGAEAWDILAKPDAPPMAILDWVMPYLTGPEVCSKVRETRREPYTYILLLTSKNSKDETIEGLEAGADDYIVKPFNQQELSVRLRAGKRIIDLQMNLMEAREELREKASKDLLTMLPNRAAIAGTLEQEVARCHRDQRSVGVILLDIDHFKKVNHTFGHFAGDAVLRETAAAPQQHANLRSSGPLWRRGILSRSTQLRTGTSGESGRTHAPASPGIQGSRRRGHRNIRLGQLWRYDFRSFRPQPRSFRARGRRSALPR
jgi:PleD family two-component response regulator